MCKETLDHLLLRCLVARELCALVFSLSEVKWVMPKTVVNLLACWKGSVVRLQGLKFGMLLCYVLYVLFGEKGIIKLLKE